MATDSWKFQDDNFIDRVDETSFKFRDSYTIKVYNCTPIGVNNDEFYVKLTGHDERLEGFLQCIFESMGIEDGSLEKTILSDNSLILETKDKNAIQLEKEQHDFHGDSRTFPIPHIKPLTKHFHLTQQHSLQVSLFVQNFRIISNKYLVMSFELKKIVYQASDDTLDMDGHHGIGHNPGLKLDDFLANYTPLAELDKSETKLYDTYDGPITSSFKIEDE